VGLEQDQLSLVNTAEELLGRNSSGFGLEIQEYSLGIPCAGHATLLYPQRLALTSPRSGSSSVSIVYLWTKATDFVLYVSFLYDIKTFFILSPALLLSCQPSSHSFELSSKTVPTNPWHHVSMDLKSST
jgi:hypothetical protein